MVSIPSSMSGTGKRVKRYFPSEQLAGQFAKKLRSDYHAGLRGATISPELAMMAARAAAMLEPLGLNILDAARMAADQYRAVNSPETFRERWQRYQHDHEMHWRSIYADQVARMPNWLGEDFMGMKVAGITPEIVRAAILKKSRAKSTVALRTRMVNAVISERGKERRADKIEVMTDCQCRLLLLSARRDRDETRTVAMLLFAGIRPNAEDGEITRLDWSNVGETEIYVPHDVSKTGTDRHIPITPRLARWIKGHPTEGKIIPSGWKRKWTRLRAAAGISYKKDVTRHTFASHFLAAFGEDRAKAAMGHTPNSDTLFRHYRRAVTEGRGRVYFGLDGEPG